MKERRKDAAFYTVTRHQKLHTKKGAKKRQTVSSHKHNKAVEYAIATQVFTSRINHRRRSESNCQSMVSKFDILKQLQLKYKFLLLDLWVSHPKVR